MCVTIVSEWVDGNLCSVTVFFFFFFFFAVPVSFISICSKEYGWLQWITRLAMTAVSPVVSSTSPFAIQSLPVLIQTATVLLSARSAPTVMKIEP